MGLIFRSVMALCALAVVTMIPAMASDCSALRSHLGIAKNALVEADVYQDEGNDREATVNAAIADHASSWRPGDVPKR
jgi:hypothetical protein